MTTPTGTSRHDPAWSQARAALGVTGIAEVTPFVATLRDEGPGIGRLLALLLLAVSAGLPVGALLLVGPEAGASLGAGPASVTSGLVLGVLVAGCIGLLLVALARRLGRRDSVSVGAGLAWGVAVLVVGLATRPGTVTLFAMVAIALTASVRVTGDVLAFDLAPPSTRARILCWHWAGGLLGVALGAAAVGVAMALGLTWRVVFVGIGGVCLALGLLAGRLRDTVTDAAAPTDDDAPTTSEVELGVFEAVRFVTIIPAARRSLGPVALIGTLLVPFWLTLASALEWRWAMAPDQRAFALAGVLAGVGLVVALGGRRVERGFRQDPARALRIAVGRGGFGVVLLAAGPMVEPPWLGLAFVAVGSGAILSLLPPLFLTVFAGVPAHIRTHAAGLLATFLLAVGGIGGFAYLAMVSPRFGPDLGVAMLAAPALLAVLSTRRLAPAATDAINHQVEDMLELAARRRAREAGERPPLLDCRRIDFSYGQLQVLFDVEFTVDEGEMVALLGTNGAGKSTLLKVISGLGLPSRGNVLLDGVDITHLDAERRLPLGIAQIPGGRAVFGPLSVVDNLRVYGHALGRDRKAVDAGIEATFDTFPRLAERRNQLASTLSGGEQQMLALGKALILQPRVLLIDELSLGLAPRIVGELLELVRAINDRGTAIVLVEQSVNVALSLTHRAYFMEKGEVRFEGPAQELLERRDILRSVFLEGATKGLGGGT